MKNYHMALKKLRKMWEVRRDWRDRGYLRQDDVRLFIEWCRKVNPNLPDDCPFTSQAMNFVYWETEEYLMGLIENDD